MQPGGSETHSRVQRTGARDVRPVAPLLEAGSAIQGSERLCFGIVDGKNPLQAGAPEFLSIARGKGTNNQPGIPALKVPRDQEDSLQSPVADKGCSSKIQYHRPVGSPGRVSNRLLEVRGGGFIDSPTYIDRQDIATSFSRHSDCLAVHPMLAATCIPDAVFAAVFARGGADELLEPPGEVGPGREAALVCDFGEGKLALGDQRPRAFDPAVGEVTVRRRPGRSLESAGEMEGNYILDLTNGCSYLGSTNK